MKKIEEVTIDGKSDGNISLVKLTGLKIKDIQCWISNEFGDPVLQVSRIVFENDVTVWMEGEHDMPYIGCDGGIEELKEDYLNAINPNKEDDED